MKDDQLARFIELVVFDFGEMKSFADFLKGKKNKRVPPMNLWCTGNEQFPKSCFLPAKGLRLEEVGMSVG